MNKEIRYVTRKRVLLCLSRYNVMSTQHPQGSSICHADNISNDDNLAKYIQCFEIKVSDSFNSRNFRINNSYFGNSKILGNFGMSEGCLPFTQKIRKFRTECKLKTIFFIPNGNFHGKTGFLERESKIPKRNFRMKMRVPFACFH